MNALTGTYAIPSGTTLHIFASTDGTYQLEVTRRGEAVSYTGGHSDREVRAFLSLIK
ncbi:hypothetical protein [Kitasatospora sp. McL0602]|uniref:hypothetical protein n=1 Tax=Kitasatospora sp. McL0602 TaxID=3439530 RepID=UPI003F893EB7